MPSAQHMWWSESAIVVDRCLALMFASIAVTAASMYAPPQRDSESSGSTRRSRSTRASSSCIAYGDQACVSACPTGSLIEINAYDLFRERSPAMAQLARHGFDADLTKRDRKEVLPVMRKQRYGNVVLMGSDQVLVGKGSSSVYGLSKAAIGQLTKSTAIDYAQHNVRVNCICPGTIDTPMLPPTIERFHQVSGIPIDQIYDMLRKSQPIQRLGTPEEIGRAVLFMLSDECPFMTGALVSADGGYTCW